MLHRTSVKKKYTLYQKTGLFKAVLFCIIIFYIYLWRKIVV